MTTLIEKKWVFQSKIIHIVMMIFHMHTLLYINSLVENQECKKCINKLLWTSYHFFCMIISYTYDLHLGLQIWGPINTNNQQNGQKYRHYLCNLLQFEFYNHQNSCMFYISSNASKTIVKHRCKKNLLIKKEANCIN